MITACFAAWIPTVAFATLPQRVRSRAKLAIFDGCGTALAGVYHPAAQHLQQLITEMGSAPQVRLIGHNLRVNVLDAAWLTGTMVDAYLYSDTHFPSNAHLTSVLLPVLLALAEGRTFSGPQAITAYTVGFEVATRLAAAVHPQHYRHGWHTTAVAGVMGAAATAGCLLGLSPEQLQHALGIASSEAAGSRANFGTDTMPMHSGRAARSGILSALLAAKGFTAEPHALETSMGWLELFRGTGAVHPDGMIEGLGSDFALDRPELHFKLYPNGAPTHRYVDAALALRRQGITAEHIRQIVCHVNATYTQTLRYPIPQTPQQARVSLPYAVAVALCDGQVGLPQFNPSRLHAEDVQALIQRVVLQEDTALSDSAASDFLASPAVVEIELLDGRRVAETVEHAAGSPERPPQRSEFEAKFRQCAKTVLSTEQILLAMRFLYQLDTLAEMHYLLDVLSLAPAET